MNIRTIIAAAALILPSVPANAASLIYSFTTNEPFAGGTVAFTYAPTGDLPLGVFIPRSALTTATPGVARIRFTDACFIFIPGQPSSTACDIVEAIVDTPTGSAQVYRFFGDGALTTPGTYAPLVGAPATFTVTTAAAVPEPAAWAMLIVGTGAAGASLRIRRRSAAAA